MAFARTLAGELPLRWEGKDYVLTPEGDDLPDDLVENIAKHVNVSTTKATKSEAAKLEAAKSAAAKPDQAHPERGR